MKILFDLFPVLFFFTVYSITHDIFWATTAAIAATFVQLVYSWIRYRKIDPMLWVSFILITVLGGLTLIFHNKTFILWKPTVLYWLLSVFLLGSWFFRNINWIERLMGKQVIVPKPIWLRLLFSWSIFFIVMGIINLVVAFYCSEITWVRFKLFGTVCLIFIFALLQAVYLARFMVKHK